MTAEQEKLAHYERLLNFVRDLKDHGLRFDLNPTVAWRGSTAEEQTETLARAYLEYINRMDSSIRERALSALEFVP